MRFQYTKAPVLNRGTPTESFLSELIAWGKTADESIFARNERKDIYTKIFPELGPWQSDKHRRAAMLEVMRVLAGFESSWDWKEGVDTSRLGATTPENAEAGAWQVSYDARFLAVELKDLIAANGITGGISFQQATKFDHPFAMEFVARLMRYNTKHNGPLYKDAERLAIRSSLRDAKHSIYPWLSRKAVQEFMEFLG